MTSASGFENKTSSCRAANLVSRTKSRRAFGIGPVQSAPLMETDRAKQSKAHQLRCRKWTSEEFAIRKSEFDIRRTNGDSGVDLGESLSTQTDCCSGKRCTLHHLDKTDEVFPPRPWRVITLLTQSLTRERRVSEPSDMKEIFHL